MNRRSIGSSILPYAIDDQHNNIFFLLGAERNIPNWVDSGKFSDFGGGTKYKTETPQKTAAREFHEETCACVPFDESEQEMVIRPTWDRIVTELEQEKYSFCLRTNIDDNKCYYTYVKQIPFNAGIPRKSANIVSNLLRIRNTIRTTGTYTFSKHDNWLVTHPAVRICEETPMTCTGISRDYLEKQQLVWISITHAKMLLNGNTPDQSIRGRKKFIFRDSFHARFKTIVDEFYKSVARLNDPLKLSMQHNKPRYDVKRYNNIADNGTGGGDKCHNDKYQSLDLVKQNNLATPNRPNKQKYSLKIPFTEVRGAKYSACESTLQIPGSNVSNIGGLQIV